jgi:translation elongation factor EF-1alpha
VQIKLLHIREEDDDVVQKGHVVCFRDQVMPSSMIFEAEIEILELPEFKPILSRGYQCMLHMHTFADEAFVKDILIA